MLHDRLQCIYVIWRGDTPDKGVAYNNIVDYDRARERLDTAKLGYRTAVIPVLDPLSADKEIDRIIKEATNG